MLTPPDLPDDVPGLLKVIALQLHALTIKAEQRAYSVLSELNGIRDELSRLQSGRADDAADDWWKQGPEQED